ncbi:MAG: ATP-binding protein [Actinomycetota bacterium]|nr:ATP-binding protein [Actinomycetota bacterium]
MTVRDEILVAISSDRDIVLARQTGRSMATELGLSKSEATLLATAISEVARNIVQYVGDGQILLCIVNGSGTDGIKVIASDSGPGIENVELALQDGQSSGGRLGLGLPGARRLMDEFHMVSRVGEGTTVTMTKWKAAWRE